MSKIEGYLNISLAWDENEPDLVTMEQVFEFLPAGVNCDLYTWDTEPDLFPPAEIDVGWKLLARNFEPDDRGE